MNKIAENKVNNVPGQNVPGQNLPDLSVTFCGIRFSNPLIAASTDMSREDKGLAELLESGVAGVITKSVTDAKALQAKGIARFDIRGPKQEKVRGDLPEQYTFFSRGGNMVSMEAFRNYGPRQLSMAKEKGVVLIGSISASLTENWVAYAKEMEEMGFPMLELNFGNPHGEAADGKLGFLIGQSPELCCSIAGKVMEAVRIPVMVKLTPQVSDLAALARALRDIGVKAVTVMHRYQGLIVDVMEEEVALGGWAAVGGPWMKPISLGNIAKVYRTAPELAVCGGNGANNGRDLLEYIACGAGLVQIGSTLMLRGPEAADGILRESRELCQKKGLDSIEDLKGILADKIVTYKNLGELPEQKSQIDFDRCEDCKEKPCISRCYFGALKEKAGILGKDDEKCTGCSMCLHVCPRSAVTMEIERGE